MSEPMPAEIWIGGKISRCFVPGLCRAIGDAGASLECDGADKFMPQTVDSLLSSRTSQGDALLLRLYDSEAANGEFPLLETFLIESQIAFRRMSEAQCELKAEVVENRPGMKLLRYPSDEEFEPLVSMYDLRAIAEAVDMAANTAEGKTALELLRRLRNLQELVHKRMPAVAPPLEPFEIVD